MSWIVGCDTGGTFTDVFAVSDRGESRVAKVPSTPPRFDLGVVEGVRALGIEPSEVTTLFHGTTVTTNAVITRTGAHSALVTTRGFRDVLEIRRANRAELYDILWDPPEPLIRRRHRLEIDERVDYAGAVVVPLDEESVRAVARKLRAREIESVAICLINAHMNPAHERRAREILLEEQPGLHISLSTDILPEPPEFERTATTVANAYCAPVLRRYMDTLEEALDEAGFRSDVVLVMHNGGGTMTTDYAKGVAVKTLHSGPAAGVIAAAAVAASAGRAERRRLRHGWHERRHRRRPGRRATADALVRPRVGHADPLPEHRRRLDRRGRRLDRVARPGRLSAQRPAERGRRSRARVLWQGRDRADQHRRPARARARQQRSLPRRAHAARRRARGRGAA